MFDDTIREGNVLQKNSLISSIGGKIMNDGTCIVFVLFYVFRHYKRVGVTTERKQLVSDLKKCHLLLERIEKNVAPEASIELVGELIERINSFGANMKLQQPLRYADNYDSEIIVIMSRITREIINFAKCPFYKRYSSQIFTRFLVLCNLSRSLLNDSSGDMSTTQNFHISKQEALECVAMYLSDKQG